MLVWVQIRPRIRGRYAGRVLKCNVKIISPVLGTVLEQLFPPGPFSTLSEEQQNKRAQIFKEIVKLLSL